MGDLRMCPLSVLSQSYPHGARVPRGHVEIVPQNPGGRHVADGACRK